MARDENDEANTFLAMNLPPTAGQSWSALAAAGVAFVGFAAVAPFAGRPLAQLNAFFPSLDAIVFVTDLVTAILLFAQFSISRSRSLLALASGYLFTALIVVPHALTFSGAFSVNGLLGANNQTGSWLFIFWHIGFAAALLVYAVLRAQKTAPISKAPPGRAIGYAIIAVVCLVCALTWLATKGATLLPPIILDNTRISPIVIYPIWLTILISAAALLVLWMRRDRSELDQWLMVVALVLIGELAFSGLLPSVRFSVGFYAGRMFSLITSSIVLILLLAETTRLYVRLARTNAMVQRERNNKLMNLEAMVASIAHEVRQPLSGITTSAAATLRFFKQAPPNIEKAESAVKMIVDASYRVSGIFDNILVLFGKGELPKEQVDLNRLALDALRDLDYECKKYSIVTSVELAAGLLPVMANEGQLREVVVNVVRNAIEAMESVKGPRTLKVTTELDVGDAVVIAVADTGPGLSPERADTIFDPFVTAKPGGMGLGLAICRMILDRHKGEISVSTAKPRGTIFRIALPGTGLPH